MGKDFFHLIALQTNHPKYILLYNNHIFTNLQPSTHEAHDNLKIMKQPGQAAATINRMPRYANLMFNCQGIQIPSLLDSLNGNSWIFLGFRILIDFLYTKQNKLYDHYL